MKPRKMWNPLKANKEAAKDFIDAQESRYLIEVLDYGMKLALPIIMTMIMSINMVLYYMKLYVIAAFIFLWLIDFMIFSWYVLKEIQKRMNNDK